MMEKAKTEENGASTKDNTLYENSEPLNDNNFMQALSETITEPAKNIDEPPVDWLEPLEDDCEDEDNNQSLGIGGMKGGELENLAAEKEQSGSLAGREIKFRSKGGDDTVGGKGRKRRIGADDDWEDCPLLGEGWKRKVVLRRSGMSMGQKDVYYLSPQGDRVRSKIELLKLFGNEMDLTKFDYKLGQNVDGKLPRRSVKRKKKERSPLEDCGFSSESSFQNETVDPDDRTGSPGPPFNLNPIAQHSRSMGQKDGKFYQSSSPALVSPSRVPSGQNVLSNAGFPCKTSSLRIDPSAKAFLGICIRCRNSFTGVNGQTVCDACSEACNVSEDNRLVTPKNYSDSDELSPFLEDDDKPGTDRSRLYNSYSDKKIFQNDSQNWEFEVSDNEAQLERRKKFSAVAERRLEKKKFGRSYYCGQGLETEERDLLKNIKKCPGVEDRTPSCFPGTEQNADDSDEDFITPTITQLFSLGEENSADSGLDLELLELLTSLREAVLPVLWCALLIEGPRLQLLQCSKLSSMADTIVQIEPTFRYHISVQGQPLLPTHILYHAHPTHLTSVTQVANLLEDLERYSVCRGFKREPPFAAEPIIQVRAATCEFLVEPEAVRCVRCKSTQQKL